jgi:two-component system, cell cycle sensor histidine kinase and response regulator CckA
MGESSDTVVSRPPSNPAFWRMMMVLSGLMILGGLALSAEDSGFFTLLSGWLLSQAVIPASAALVAGSLLLLWIGGRATNFKPIMARIAETASEGFVVVELATGRALYANAAYRDLMRSGGSNELVPLDLLLASAKEAAPPFYRLSLLAKEGKEGQEDIRLIKGLNSESPAWYRVRTTPMPTSSRRKLVLWGITDITRERERQENVFQELQYAIDFLDHAPAGFFSLHPNGDVVYLNATLAQWLGHDLATIPTDHLKWADLSTANGADLLAIRPGEPGETHTEIVDLDLRSVDERLVPVRIFHQVMFDGAGRAGASRSLVLNRLRDGADDEGQRKAEIRFARFFNNSPFGIATVRADGELVQTNVAFSRLLPSDRQKDGSVAFNRIGSIIADHDRKQFEERLAMAVDGKVDLPPLDVQLISGSRSARVYVVHTEGVDDPTEAAMVFVLDTTDQRTLEAQFVQAQKMQAVGELAGGIAHDFNNVLQVILGHADLLLGHHRPTDPSFQDIMQIKQNANRAAGLVRHLLAFSRRQTLRPVTVQLVEVLSDLSTLLKRLLGYQIELDIRHERELWSCKADPTQFEQVIVNLAVNARDAMPKGGAFTVRTSNVTSAASRSLGDPTIPPAEYVMIEITDTGEGIAPEILDKIFEPFFTTKEVGKGTGLGLSMVYGFVKQSGGYILCESEPGKGTRFRILLPRYIPTEAVEVPAEKAPAGKQTLVDLSGQETILLVEDEDAVRAFGARALAQRGYHVLEASSGLDALDVLAAYEGEIDLIVSDVVMPEMDGPTMLRELRERGITAKVIFASGYAEEAFSKNLPEGEQFGFLPKPFSLKQLVETVKTALNS